MGRYVNPGRCLECQGSLLIGASVCAECGLSQVGPAADLLRSRLELAEEALVDARLAGRAASAGFGGELMAGPPGEAPQPVMSTPVLPAMEPVAARRGLPAISTPVVLLGLGAVCVLVAAVVFVAVAWSDLTLAAKAAILVGITLLIGYAAYVSLNRHLRGSAETLSTLFAVFVVIDFVSARLSGLDWMAGLTFAATRWVAGLLAVVAGVGWALVGRQDDGKALVGVQVVAALGFFWVCLEALDQVPLRPEFVALILVAVAVLLAGTAVRVSLRVLAVALAATAGGLFLVAWLASLVRVFEAADLAGLWGSGRAVGWLLCCLVLAGAAVIPAVPTMFQTVAASLSVGGLSLLLLRPLEGSSVDVFLAATAGTCLALALLSAFVVVRGPWHVGVGVSAVGVGVAATVVVLPWMVEAGVRAVRPADDPWQLDVTDQVAGLDLGLDRGTPLAVLMATLTLVVAGWALLRGRLPSVGAGAITVSVALAMVVIRHTLPMWQPVAVLVTVTAVSAAVAFVTRHQPALLATLGSAGLTLVSALGAEVTTVVVAAGLAACLFTLVWKPLSGAARDLAATGAMAMTGLTAAASLALADVGEGPTAGVIGLLGAGAFVAAQTHGGTSRVRGRVGFELGSGMLLVVGLVLALDHVAVVLPVALTLAGLALTSAGLLSPDRRVLMRPGAVLLAAATWVRLWAEDVTVVEAYTLPSAVVLCALGAWRMRRTPEAASTRALVPGLALALVPSLVATLPDPTSLRALLVGMAALVVLLAGVALQWAAPLVLGALVLLTLALMNLAPYAAAVPRWVLFGTVGAGLLFLGVTWESRLRDARRLTSSLQRLR